MNEEWRYIPGYENKYMVSNIGRVKSVDREVFTTNGQRRFYKSKILRQRPTSDRFSVALGFKNEYKVHVLVAMAFLGHKLNGHKEVVDHINCNPKDNRVENLQIVSQHENALYGIKKSKSGYRGVSKHGKNRWRACICIKGKKRHIGTFKTKEEAHLAYLYELKTKANIEYDGIRDK